MIYNIMQLREIALGLINAMILEGPNNEEELHILQVLLDPQEDDSLADAVTAANRRISDAYRD